MKVRDGFATLFLAAALLALSGRAGAAPLGVDCAAFEVVPGQRTSHGGQPAAVGRYYYTDVMRFDVAVNPLRLEEPWRKHVLETTPRLPGSVLVVECGVEMKGRPYPRIWDSASAGRLSITRASVITGGNRQLTSFRNSREELDAFSPRRLAFQPDPTGKTYVGNEDPALFFRCAAVGGDFSRLPRPYDHETRAGLYDRGSEIHVSKTVLVPGRTPARRLTDDFQDWTKEKLGHEAFFTCFQSPMRERIDAAQAVFINRFTLSARQRDAAWAPNPELYQEPPASAGRGGASPGAAPTGASLTIEPAPDAGRAALSRFGQRQAEVDGVVREKVAAALKDLPTPPRVDPEPAREQPAPERNCRMVPQDRGTVARSGGARTQAEALSLARARIPAACTPTGSSSCDRYPDMPPGTKNFLADFKKHVRNPQWKYGCDVRYTCPHHVRRVCDGTPAPPGGASRQ